MRENKKGSYMTQQKRAVVGQSGGPTSAINATLAGVISGCLSEGFTEIYGMKNGVKAPRLMLHAWRLSFTHPRTGERLSFCAEPPEAFARTLEKLRNHP